MSTEPTPTPDTRPTEDAASTEDAAPTEETTPTDIAARGREDRWAAGDGPAVDRGSPAGRSQLLFDPRSIARLRNLVDEENAYCS